MKIKAIVNRPFLGHKKGDVIECSPARFEIWARKSLVVTAEPYRVKKIRAVVPDNPESGKSVQIVSRTEDPGPSQTKPDGPELTKSTETKYKIDPVGRGWYTVTTPIGTVMNSNGEPKKFRKDEAEAFRE